MAAISKLSGLLEWSRYAPLHELCIHIADLYQKDKHTLDGRVLACLASRLIAAEAQPGGPYRDATGRIDPQTTLAACYLFAVLGKPLPNADKLLKELRQQSQSRTIQSLLKKYETLLHPRKDPTPTNPIAAKSYHLAAEELGKLRPPLRNQALSFLERIKKADKNYEIVLIPTYFSDSLATPGTDIPLSILGEANLYCWIAYTIYDHILDGEPAHEYLPTANVAMRLAERRYQSFFPKDHPFQQKIADIFTGMDHANSWELMHCRFPVHNNFITISRLPAYGRLDLLAQRSLGHILGPLAIANLSPNQAPRQLEELEKGLRHYLIARQLSDDIHDWQEDIRAGHSSAVVTYMLKSQQVAMGSYHIDALVTEMKTNFWRHSMQATNDLIHHHSKRAKYHLDKSRLLKPENDILSLVSRLDSIAAESDEERQKYKSFSKMYRELRAS